MTTSRELRRVLRRNEFDVAYQPIVSLTSGRTIAVEALLRWPQRPEVEVSGLIGEIEHHGLIGEFGTWVLDRSCEQLARWRHEFAATRHWTMSVNVSALQIDGDAGRTLLHAVDDTLQRHRLDSESLCLEITESNPMETSPDASRTLTQLRTSGVLLAIDDFGAGFASLAQLRDVAVDYIKIDREFLIDVTTSERSQALVVAMATLATAVGMATIAEGIEDAAQARFIADLGVEYGQGYFFAKPMDGAEMSRQLRSANGRSGRGDPIATPIPPRPDLPQIPRARRADEHGGS